MYANETNKRINLSFNNAVNDENETNNLCTSKSNRWNVKTLAPDCFSVNFTLAVYDEKKNCFIFVADSLER